MLTFRTFAALCKPSKKLNKMSQLKRIVTVWCVYDRQNRMNQCINSFTPSLKKSSHHKMCVVLEREICMHCYPLVTQHYLEVKKKKSAFWHTWISLLTQEDPLFIVRRRVMRWGRGVHIRYPGIGWAWRQGTCQITHFKINKIKIHSWIYMNKLPFGWCLDCCWPVM